MTTRRRLSQVARQAIKALVALGETRASTARRFGVACSTVSRVARDSPHLNATQLAAFIATEQPREPWRAILERRLAQLTDCACCLGELTSEGEQFDGVCARCAAKGPSCTAAPDARDIEDWQPYEVEAAE